MSRLLMTIEFEFISVMCFNGSLITFLPETTKKESIPPKNNHTAADNRIISLTN